MAHALAACLPHPPLPNKGLNQTDAYLEMWSCFYFWRFLVLLQSSPYACKWTAFLAIARYPAVSTVVFVVRRRTWKANEIRSNDFLSGRPWPRGRFPLLRLMAPFSPLSLTGLRQRDGKSFSYRVAYEGNDNLTREVLCCKECCFLASEAIFQRLGPPCSFLFPIADSAPAARRK